MSIFIICDLERDPNADVEKLIDEFMPNYYGKAAPFTRKIYNRISEITENKPHYVRCESYAPGMLTKREYREFYALFKSAEEAVADKPSQLKRVKREKFPYLFCDLTENNPANGREALNGEFAGKLQEWVYIYLEIKDKDWQLFRSGRHWESIKGAGEFRNWITNICGLDTQGKHLYQSSMINEFSKVADPVKFLTAHCDPDKMYPYGLNIALSSGRAKTRIYTQEKAEKLLDEHGVPMAELWLGNNVKTSNQFPVIEVKNGETVKAVIDYIDNPWDTFLEITALAEEAPLYTEFIITINPGKKQEKTIRKKVVFDSAKKWVRFTVPIDSDNLIRVQDSYIHCDEKDLKYGMDMGHNSFTVKSNCSGKNNILIRNFRLLF